MSTARQPDRPTRRFALPACAVVPAAAVLVATIGCDERDGVRSYAVPKEDAPRAAVPEAPLAAVPAATSGPAVMRWELPAGWEAAANPNSMRFATLIAGSGDGAMEVAITQLAGAAGGVAANINRWRDQIGLAPQSDEEIQDEAELVRARGAQGFLVDLVAPDPHGAGGDGLRMFAAIFPRQIDTWFIKAVGPSEGLGPHRDAFVALCESVTFGDAAPAPAPAAAAPPREPSPAGSPSPPPAGSAPAWAALPAGWTADAAPAAMSVASFTVTDGAQHASVTLTPLGGGQELLANVNRWRRQVGLGALGAMSEDPPAPIDVGGAPGSLVDVAGPGGHTIAVMCDLPGATWFVKMSGPDPLVAGARPDFEAFVRGLALGGGEDE